MLNTTIKLRLLLLMGNERYTAMAYFYEIIGFSFLVLNCCYFMHAYSITRLYSFVNIIAYACINLYFYDDNSVRYEEMVQHTIAKRLSEDIKRHL